MNEQRAKRVSELIHSPDENCYYFEYWEPDHWYQSTETYPTKKDAMDALREGKVEWKEV